MPKEIEASGYASSPCPHACARQELKSDRARRLWGACRAVRDGARSTHSRAARRLMLGVRHAGAELSSSPPCSLEKDPDLTRVVCRSFTCGFVVGPGGTREPIRLRPQDVDDPPR